jgi:hypothetical protein
MKILMLVLTFATSALFFHLSAQSLDQIKIAADAGDPVAQDKMGERDYANAEMWYRKAANQGYVHAQGRLGNLLLLRYRMSFNLKPDAKAALGDEAIQWMTLAANQGDPQGQANFADVCLEGKLVKQDLIEAYKWGELATHGGDLINIPGIMGSGSRDGAILKMNADQIAEAKGRVADFKPHLPNKSDVPTPAWVKQIKLNGISGGPAKRFATIGKETLEQGETGTVKVGGKTVAIKCLAITETTAKISIEGIDGTQTLNLN